ncbi:signal peptidase II [Schaalia naturae]|uniref:Lipoprotein signal peptidase n=1 Tax=Schaalia naturae TaxID=635203 RepID=A0ABW2SLW3_9ACTO
MTEVPARRRGWPVMLVVAVAAAAADQATKHWAVGALAEGETRPLVGDALTLQLVRNSGAAFSLGANATWIFTILSAAIVAGIAVCAPRIAHLPTAAALGLLGGGAVGNLIDRLIRPPAFGRGHVVDFINYNGWFVGNIADVWIVVAALWLAVMYATAGPRGGREGADDE